ncbi:MAG: 16S rRNA (cytosine(967)-C(5))-methyltransferase RsmB [Limnochordaceae bacterium]|nr:16S rRNA (cytosine(967)-C(5))-methyltransferase RsmB [Limnochordaceae bacterium]
MRSAFTSTPPPIAVDLAVRLTRRLHPEASGFVNAVLRALVRASRDGMPAPAGGPVDERLAITYGHPRWLVRRWLDRFGLATTEAILRANNEPSPPTVRVNLMRTTPASLQRRWAAEGIPSGVGALVSFALEIHLPGRSLEQLPGYDEGLFSPQSEASMLPALVVGSVAGETAADLCSAPGGKATQMAEMAEDQAHVLAFDRHAGRLGLVRRNARRLGLRSLRFAVADARRPPLGAGSLDAVLLDAPCTDLGTVRRRPDVRWRRRPEDVEEMARLQRQLLDAAAGLIRPGGRLVYSVCSFEREETTDHLAYVAERHGMQAVPVEAMAAWRGPRGTGADREGMTLLPHEVRTDGFFVVRFEPLRRV